MITLYHGSIVKVPHPLVASGRDNLDFGKGFYLTAIREQAEKWALVLAERRGRKALAYLNIYDFDDERARATCRSWLNFDTYNMEWLEYVIRCRRGERIWAAHDVVEGGVANDNVIDTVEDYAMGVITAEQALGQLKYKRVNHQICIVRQWVVYECLRFRKSVVIEREEGLL